MLNAQKVQRLRNQNANKKIQEGIEYQQKDFEEMVERLEIVQQLQQIQAMPKRPPLPSQKETDKLSKL